MANAWIIKPLAMSSISASATNSGFAASNLGNDYAGVVWQTSVNGYRAIDVDLGADTPIDTLMLFGIGNGATNPSVSTYYKTAAGVAGSWIPALVGAALYAGSAPLPAGRTGTGLYDLGNGVTARYVRVELPSNFDGLIQASRLIIGKRIQLERNFSFGAALGVRDLGSLDFSRRGVLIRNEGKKLRTVGLTFSNINKDEVETLTKPLLEEIGNTKMIALVTDPAPHAQRQNRCYFGSLVGDLGHVQRNARGWEAKVNMVSIF